jgi:DNA polymerase-3 subunit delta'
MIFGHQKNLKLFSKFLEEKRFPHAVLFTGPNKIGKRKVAIEITKYLEGKHNEDFFSFSQRNCNCQICQLIENKNFPDLIEIKSGDGQISIQEIREIRKNLSMAPLYSFKIVVLNNVEKLSQEATGALLKILEEPRGNTIFFLLTSLPSILPKTILSRITIFKFNLLSKEEIKKYLDSLNIKIPFQNKDKIIDLSLGRSEIAKEISIDGKKLLYYNSLLENIESSYKLSIFERFKLSETIEKTAKTEDFLFLADFWFRDLLLAKNKIESFSFDFKKREIKEIANKFTKEGLKEVLRELSKIKKYIFFSNVSRLLALENLLIKI